MFVLKKINFIFFLIYYQKIIMLKDNIICIIILLFIFYIIYNKIINKYYGNHIFVSLLNIDNTDINYSLLLSHNNQINKIKMYYINMDKSVDRNNRFLNRMKEFKNYDIVRIKAITPEDLYNYKLTIPWYCKMMHDKEKSCLLSHIKAIETSYNNNDEYSIIAEDDMILTKNINWEYFLSVLPDDWDIIQLYYFKLPFYNSSYFKTLQKQNFLIKTNNILTSAAAYLINKNGMKKILKYKNENNIDLSKHNKHCLADYVIYNDVNRYILTYPIIKTEELDSTLNPHHIFARRVLNIL